MLRSHLLILLPILECIYHWEKTRTAVVRVIRREAKSLATKERSNGQMILTREASVLSGAALRRYSEPQRGG